jgi:hypothetical protein
MSWLHDRVSPDEIFVLKCETERLLRLGALATEEARDALRDWKIDVLNRIALDPGPFLDEVEGEQIREIARRETLALRLGLPSPLCELGGGEPA